MYIQNRRNTKRYLIAVEVLRHEKHIKDNIYFMYKRLNMPDLVKCGRCHSVMETKYFNINRKGTRNKCCEFCLIKYQCNLCDYKCSKQQQMREHIITSHRITT